MARLPKLELQLKGDQTMKGKLYLCPTPIGNLGDITYRTLETLKSVDLIAAEDTRVSMKLLNHFEIKKPVTSYYEHNKREKGDYLIQKLISGTTVAIVTDAGMPGISDPGEDLVRQCIENNIPVESLPGPCAFATALVASGLPTGRFTFEGFLSVNKKSRREHLLSLTDETRTMIFYEAPHKLIYTLRDMAEVFGGERKIVLARELTKKYEEYLHTTLGGAVTHFEKTPPKGEFVLIIAGADIEKVKEKRREELPDAETLIAEYINQGLKGKEIAKLVSEKTDISKNEAYELFLKLKS